MSNQYAGRYERRERRKDVARLYLQGWTQREIAEELRTTQSVVSRDLKAVRDQWEKAAVRALRMGRAAELARLDAIEKGLWREWEKSQEPRTMRQVSRDQTTGRTKITVGMTTRHGDPYYLALIQQCILLRIPLLVKKKSRGVERVGPPREVDRERLLAMCDAPAPRRLPVLPNLPWMGLLPGRRESARADPKVKNA